MAQKVDFECPKCNKITEGCLLDTGEEYDSIDEKLIGYKHIYCEECESHFNIVATYKIHLEPLSEETEEFWCQQKQK